MLALSRGEGQSIIIDGRIEVKIVKWSRSSVRLAIQAPREVKVDRDEIWRRENPGKASPLEVAEAERRERFAREGTPAAPGPVSTDATLEPLRSPAAGRFFVRPDADAPPFVSVGSSVEASTVVGILETTANGDAAAPGEMREILASLDGNIAKILVSNAQSVERGQPLFLLKPA